MPHIGLEGLLLAASLVVALAFKPWQVLRHKPLQSPWLAAMVILPWAWWTQKLLPSGMALHLSGTCLLVLMFGWPMAVAMTVPVAVLSALLEIQGPQRLTRGAMNLPVPPTPDWSQTIDLLLTRSDAIASHALWMGVLPATLGLLIGLAMRRWLPQHVFVYILGRGFIGTALAVTFTGALGLMAHRLPPGLDTLEWMLGHWLLGWGEALSTGMLTAVFVAFKPHWLLTYSDQRYLPPPHPRGNPPPQ
ncbi:MAG: hypothetical protein RLZZ182_1154 [Pseudomonadota bacterium]|jgi:uncharacterized membrane protein